MNSLKYYYTEFTYQVKCLINFFKNIWRFRKPLYQFRWWDYYTLLQFMQIAIEHMGNRTLAKSNEVISTRIPKIAKMERASQILKNQLNDYVYMDMAEEKYGKLIDKDSNFIPLDSNPDLFTYEDNLTDEEREHNSKVFLYSVELEENEWKEFCEIIKGQGDFFEQDEWEEKFDGSGLKNWWN